MQEVIFATGNRSKLAQLRFVAETLNIGVKVVPIKDIYEGAVFYEEVGDTVREVAQNGAIVLAKRTGRALVTEDSDFRVEALNGEPGIRAGEFLKKYGRVEILKRMEGVSDRRAVINSAVAFATPDGECQVFVNTVRGQIAQEEKYGEFPDWIAPTPELSVGGGYNAIFIPDGFDRTLAEIGPVEAIPWSYREKNFHDLLKWLSESPKN